MLVSDSGEAGIGIGVVRKHVKPGDDWKLRNDHSGFPPISCIKNFKEITAFIKVKIHKPKITNDQKFKLCKLIQVFQVCGFDTGMFHFTHKSICFNISDTLELSNSSYAESIDQISLAACRGTRYD